MNADEFLEDSDSSDEDYVPETKVEEAPSEEESDGDQEDALSGSDSESKSKGKKRLKTDKRKKKKAKGSTPSEDSKNIESQTTPDPKEEKKQVEDIWADFIKDTGFKSKSAKSDCPSQSTKKQEQNTRPAPSPSNNQTKEANKKVKVTQIFEFAGEKVEVEKEVSVDSAEARLLPSSHSKNPNKKPGGLSGIGGVLSQLGKKQKISTLEKSKLDWDRFKKEEDIEEELQTYNKGKDGYLDRQDFLERADLRRFEIEKEVRNVERAKRFNSSV